MQRTPQVNMFYGAKPILFERAKKLRKNMTESECLLWRKLKNAQLGSHFRRQHPIDIFIADFYCHQYKLVIEIDGEIHNFQKDYDIGRTAELNKYDIRVVRFTNEEIKNDIERVIEQIRSYLQ